MIGQTISHYKILEKLGEGGMGAVYKAEDTKLKRTVALKFLSPLISDAKARKRFVQEAQAASSLEHPNICSIYEIDETVDGRIFIVMPCYEGETLQAKIEGGPMKVEEAVDIAIQMASGLSKAHEKEIVHRDIKPGNIFITSDGLVKIVDFGLAKLSGRTKLTKTGMTVGTVAYMSPEQARGEPTDHRTDIWSFGVSLYEMITGRLPFRGAHEHAVLYSVLNEAPDPITSVRTGVPMELERVIAKALAKRPEDRYQHVEDLIVDLRSVEKWLSAQSRTGVGSRTASRRAAADRTSRKRLIIASWILIPVVTVAVIVFVWSHYHGSTDERRAAIGGREKIRSLAVLPFDNMMEDPGQDYFVDGMHDALITRLSKLGSLRVISRTSVMRYKDTATPMPEIARELDVDALIEGSVLRVGDEVRITAQLIDGATDEHLWADSYDRDLRNVLSLLNEVAGAIADEVQAKLTPEQAERLARARPVNLDAYDALLLGQQLSNTFRPSKIRESIVYFKKAIEIDPEFAEAHAMLADAYIMLSVFGTNPMEVMPKARISAKRALELDSGLAEAQAAMGYVVLYFDRDWEAGGSVFRKALKIDPNNAMARHGYADYLLAVGRPDDSIDQCLLGRKSNPLSPLSNAVLVGHLYVARRYAEAVAEAEKLLAVDPNSQVRVFLRGAYWQMGKRDEVIEMLRDTEWAKQPPVREALDRGYKASGPSGAMLAVAQLLEAQSDTTFIDPLNIAVYYARGGADEAAMEWLEKAERDRSPTMFHTLLYPCFDSIRDTKRFKALGRRMNLPE